MTLSFDITISNFNETLSLFLNKIFVHVIIELVTDKSQIENCVIDSVPASNQVHIENMLFLIIQRFDSFEMNADKN